MYSQQVLAAAIVYIYEDAECVSIFVHHMNSVAAIQSELTYPCRHTVLQYYICNKEE